MIHKLMYIYFIIIYINIFQKINKNDYKRSLNNPCRSDD